MYISLIAKRPWRRNRRNCDPIKALASRRIPPKKKARVTLAAARDGRTANEAAVQFDMHPTGLRQWKRQLFDGLAGHFGDGRWGRGKTAGKRGRHRPVYRRNGPLRMELAWPKRLLAASGTEMMPTLVDPNGSIPHTRQCELLWLPSLAALYSRTHLPW